ncbi:MAG: response regulator [bacterium]|nr:response regulator [bacterium]
MVLYIEELLQEREREKTIREQILDRIFSIISRISRDTPQGPVKNDFEVIDTEIGAEIDSKIDTGIDKEIDEKSIGKENECSEIFNALKILHEDITNILDERQNLVIQLRKKIKSLQKKDSTLKESKDKYRSLFNNIAEPIFIFDKESLRILDCNRIVFTQYGYSIEELKKMTPFGLHPVEDWGKIKKNILEKNINKTDTYKHLTKSGDRINVEILPDEITYEGKPAWLTIARDVTVRTRVEAKLKGAIEDAERAIKDAEQANVSSSHFLANMSHEIRTPMNGIIGITDLVLTTQLNPQQKEYLKLVKESASSLLVIINDILDISKIEAGKMNIELHKFNLIIPIKKVMDSFAIRAHKKHIKLAYDIRPDVPLNLMGDEGRFRQVLLNLIGNAIKFTHKGKVTVFVKKTRTSSKLQNNTAHEYVTLLFAVKDTGIGINFDKLNKIFDSFTQVDGTLTRNFGGTGLGLSISKQLIQLMGGSIEVESNKGKGSCFYFTLPFQIVKEADIHPLTEPPELPDSAQKGKKIAPGDVKILLAEDNPINKKLIVSLIKRKGWQIRTANNGIIALETLEKYNDFDLVLMDIQMPDMDGITATKKIRTREKWNNLPIIALTAHALKGDKESFLKAGMDDYLSKPINYKELYAIIRKHLKK